MQNINWQKIYTQYSPKLLGICRRYVQDIATCEDIVQDSFISAIQHNNQLKNQEALYPWLQKIVVNNALQHLKKQTKNITENFSDQPETASEMDISDNELQNTVLAYDFSKEEILDSIDQLSYYHKMVFNLYYFENYSHQKISEELNININTSKSYLLRAKKTVQKLLLENISTNDNRRKKIGILIFLGLGNWLWAKGLENKFKNFSIQPTQKIQIPDEVLTQKVAFSATNTALKTKLIITATVVLIIIPIVYQFLLKPKKETIIEKIKPEEKSTKTIEQSSVEEKSKAPLLINPREEKKEITENKTSEKLEQSKKENLEIKKDSTNEKPQKIVVVKKIIQRDTVFIERTD